MGGTRVTQPGLVVHEVDVERNLLLVRGSVPGREERDPGDRERVMAAPKAPVIGGSTKEVSLEESVFAVELKPHLVHETVRAELNAARAGTKGTKSRGLVAGGRSKPWRQKGTGRARAGTTRAPHWTGGGVAFAPGMRSFEVKVNRKARRNGAARRALAPRVERNARDPRRLGLRRTVDAQGSRARSPRWGERPTLARRRRGRGARS